MTEILAVTLTAAQVESLRGWAAEHGHETDSDAIRAALRLALGDEFPPDPPAHGGYRGRWPRAGETAALKEDWQKNARQSYRAGTTCVVERLTRHGVLVRFGGCPPAADDSPADAAAADPLAVNDTYGSLALVKLKLLKVSA